MKPVDSLPARQRGCAISADRNGMLWRMPSMTKASSASACASIACRARRRMRDELGDHRIVVERNLAAFVDAGVVAHGDAVDAALGRRAIARQPPGRGQEIAIRVLGIDAAFHRPAVELHVALLDRQLLAGGDADHLLDQIDAGDRVRSPDARPAAACSSRGRRSSCPARRRIRPCRRCRSRRPWPARPPARPSSCASPRRAAGTAPPRSPSDCGAGSSIRARRDR